ncbi:uncharacterized protein I303_103005 [Kwoniella dejecticola CBS 10117]|uniref:Uncharacterized protein n=1 Tax=Kwoniella dejecticola CBS 10117 TaxID=1296121 RepID=A0A1A6AAB8_9TREE|nr:uncharacterized protein I303_03024 [Kwoniella dejecticola CBS 10117]OBR87002.1 hypothetical protein I303_03024 [Kwoniella dejecticola CBS 10117]
MSESGPLRNHTALFIVIMARIEVATRTRNTKTGKYHLCQRHPVGGTRFVLKPSATYNPDSEVNFYEFSKDDVEKFREKGLTHWEFDLNNDKTQVNASYSQAGSAEEHDDSSSVYVGNPHAAGHDDSTAQNNTGAGGSQA